MCLTRAGVAQLVEQLICNQQVVGSTPIASSISCCSPLFSLVAGFPPGTWLLRRAKRSLNAQVSAGRFGQVALVVQVYQRIPA